MKVWPRPPEEPFPPPFQALLTAILARAARVQGGRTEVARARQRALSQSGTFVGHRAYAPGDDLRRLDWHAFARTGHLFLKLLEEDERRQTTLLLDTSASMLAGEPARWTGMLRLAAILGGLALRHLDGVRIVAGGTDVAFAGSAGLPPMLQHLRASTPRPFDPVAAAQSVVARGAPGRIAWLSDFADPTTVERALAVLRRRGARVVGWQPMIAEDLDVPVRGWLRLVDPETGVAESIAVDAELAAAMREELVRLRRRQDRAFVSFGYPLQRFPLPAATDFRLASWLEAAWRRRS